MKIVLRFFLVFTIFIIINVIGMLYNYLNLHKSTENVKSIYNLRLKSIEYLVSADRDAHRSSLEISKLLNIGSLNDEKTIDFQMEAVDRYRRKAKKNNRLLSPTSTNLMQMFCSIEKKRIYQCYRTSRLHRSLRGWRPGHPAAARCD